MAATEPIRDKNQLKALSEYFLKRGQLRNYVLVVLGVHTALRISDLLRLKWVDVYDKERGDFRAHVTITEKKTGKTKTIALNKHAVNALRLYFPHQRGEFIFVSNRKNGKAISRIQAWRSFMGQCWRSASRGKLLATAFVRLGGIMPGRARLFRRWSLWTFITTAVMR